MVSHGNAAVGNCFAIAYLVVPSSSCGKLRYLRTIYYLSLCPCLVFVSLTNGYQECLLWYFNLPGEVTGASVVVWRILGFIGCGEGVLGSGVVLLTGGLVVRGTGFAAVLVIMMGTVVVRAWGLGVVLAGTGGRWGELVAGTWGCTGAAGVGTAGKVQKQRRRRES